MAVGSDADVSLAAVATAASAVVAAVGSPRSTAAVVPPAARTLAKSLSAPASLQWLRATIGAMCFATK